MDKPSISWCRISSTVAWCHVNSSMPHFSSLDFVFFSCAEADPQQEMGTGDLWVGRVGTRTDITHSPRPGQEGRRAQGCSGVGEEGEKKALELEEQCELKLEVESVKIAMKEKIKRVATPTKL